MKNIKQYKLMSFIGQIRMRLVLRHTALSRKSSVIIPVNSETILFRTLFHHIQYFRIIGVLLFKIIKLFHKINEKNIFQNFIFSRNNSIGNRWKTIYVASLIKQTINQYFLFDYNTLLRTTNTEAMESNHFGLFLPFEIPVFLIGPQSPQDQQENGQTEQENQNQNSPAKRRERREDGRTTNIVPNIFKALQKSKKNLRKDLLNIAGQDRPREWTAKAELILLCLKYRETSSKEREVFTEEIKKILDKMIQFRTKKMAISERIQFNLMNRNLLETIQRICLGLLNREAMPEPHEIKSILTVLMKGNEENQGSLVVQSAKITQGFDFILRQFPIYRDKMWQDKDISISETTEISAVSQKHQTSSQTQEKI